MAPLPEPEPTEPEPAEAHSRFHQRLAAIDADVVRLFALVSENVTAAGEALLAGDPDTARGVTGREVRVDRLERDLETAVERQLLLQTPMAGDMRYLVTVLRIVPQLERCSDLAHHIADRAAGGLATRLTPTLRGLLTDIGDQCSHMWTDVARAWAERDPTAARRLDRADDRLDNLHDQLTAALLDGRVARADAIQTTLLGRFYERLGDHTVHIAQRIRHVAAHRTASTR